MLKPFENRATAGRSLAAVLAHHRDNPDLLVLGLARGGLPVAAAVAAGLGAELDVLVIRKIRAPDHPELAIGAVGPGAVRILNHDIVVDLNITPEQLTQGTRRARDEQREREALYHQRQSPATVRGRTVILVDDGLATGATLEAAIATMRYQKARRIIIAIPVAAPEACRRLANRVDEFVALRKPWAFGAVSAWYRHFDQTSDETVLALLDKARAPRAVNAHTPAHTPAPRDSGPRIGGVSS